MAASDDEPEPAENRLPNGTASMRRIWLVHAELVVLSEATLDPDVITGRVGLAPTSAFRDPKPTEGAKAILEHPHLWKWRPSADVPTEIDAQLDAMWTATAHSEAAFRDLAG